MIKMRCCQSALSLLLIVLSISPTLATKKICYGDCTEDGDSKSCTFTFHVDLFASERGYFKVDECGDEIMPTLGIEKGVTYHFIQHDLTNYMHALGFAYYPDGAHDDKDELEPGVTPPGSSSSCADDMTCPAPMYMLNEEMLGKYSNNDAIAPVTKDEEDFGLDVYEPQFFRPPDQWAGYGQHSVSLKFDVEDFTDDIFYFCHVHSLMSGRMKFVDSDGEKLNNFDTPAIPYFYERPSEYDQMCGTSGLEAYQLPHPECNEKFVCGVNEETSPMLRQFSGCIDSMDCAMQVGMTTGIASKSAIALFNHQMIPHHQNAVNMAKALMKSGDLLESGEPLNCPDITEESDDCTLLIILYEIVNGQNYQIQQMQEVLESKGYLEEDDCPVPVMTFEELMELKKDDVLDSIPENSLSDIIEEKTEDIAVTGKSLDGTPVMGNEELCLGKCEGEGDSKLCTFTAKVDLHASELGYYHFEECGDQIMPTLGFEKGVTYHFLQHDLTNYMHPLGLAYYPDGDHADEIELEPGIVPPGSASSCEDDMTCPAPMYMLNDELVGKYSNNAYLAPVTQDEEDFGLDVYEPEFYWPSDQWVENGLYSLAVKFDVDDFIQDIFYFCHIHQFMSGRIKFVDADGNILHDENIPEIPYPYEQPSEYDQKCGTYNLEQYQLPNPQCKDMYVCNVPEDDSLIARFSHCIDSMNCAMQAGMTTKITSGSAVALFNHQMIPHHQNAVNMAKALLSEGEIQCDDILEETDDCTMMKIMYEIVNGQNHQIQKMREILESKGWPPVDDCKVAVSGITKEIIMEEHYSDVKSEVGESAASSHIISIVAVFLSFLPFMFV